MSGFLRRSFGDDPAKLKKVGVGELVVRFAFGAAISLVAGFVGLAAGARAGGMFLAFPAILPAALTMIERKEGRRQALEDERGSVYGALGLIVFAVVCEALIVGLAAVVTLAVALAAWAVSAVACYLAATALHRPAEARD
jgi:hypothetical protein